MTSIDGNQRMTRHMLSFDDQAACCGNAWAFVPRLPRRLQVFGD
jgi:hypothetical protein